MKLYQSDIINKLDVATIHLGTHQLELIDKASTAFVQFIIPKISKTQNILCLCGTGNNGVDGLYIGKKLSALGYQVRVICIEAKPKLSDLFLQTKDMVRNCKIPVTSIHPMEGIGELKHFDVFIDGIFGNGLNRPLSDSYLKIINELNILEKPTYAIDIPSGMRGEGEVDNVILQCTATLAFQYPKLSFFQREASRFLGKWEYVSIGIPAELINNQASDHLIIDPKIVHSFLKSRKLHSHKGNFGHALLIGGSVGMAGAIVLSATSCLKIGAGRCTILSNSENREACQVSIPEATFKAMDTTGQDFSKNTIGIGPGLGKSAKVKELLTNVIRSSKRPIVFDADALNLLAEDPALMLDIPSYSILTPHTGEFHTIFGKCDTDFQRFTVQIQEAKERSIFIALKGKFTTIACPDGTFYYNSTGNPGMATGGSGDVLTGILTGLLAQNYTPKEASILGVYLHGLSGDIAAKNIGEMSMIASDIISNIPQAISDIKIKTK